MAGVMYDFLQNIFTPQNENQIQKQDKYEIKDKTDLKPEFKMSNDKVKQSFDFYKKEDIGLKAKPDYILETVDEKLLNDELINLYSNHISLEKGNEVYTTPLLVNNLDLNSIKLNKNDFNKIYNVFNSILENSNINMKEDSSKLFLRYNNLIDNTKTDVTKELFIINLSIFICFNLHEPFFQKQFIRMLPKDIIQKGGTRLLNILKNTLGKTMQSTYERLKSVGSFVRYGLTPNYLLASGGIDIFNSIISTTQNVLPLYLTVETLNGFFGSDESSENVGVMTLLCYSILMKESYKIMKIIGSEAYYNIHNSNIKNYLTVFSYLNIDGLEQLLEKYNLKMSSTIADQIKKKLSMYMSKKYSDSMTLIKSQDLNLLTKEHNQFQQSNGFLIDHFKVGSVKEIINNNLPEEYNLERVRTFINVESEPPQFTDQGINAINLLTAGQRNNIKTLLQNSFRGNNNVTRLILRSFMPNATVFSPPPEPIIVRQTVETEMKCGSCLNNFKYYNYSNDNGYIHEVLTDIEKDLLSRDISTINKDDISEKTLYTEALKKRINSFPCRQLIEILNKKEIVLNKYKLDINYDNDIEDGTGKYGDQLICSNCAYQQIKGQYAEGTWPLYLGSQSEQLNLELNDIQKLITDLSPKELEIISLSDYNSNRISYSKINQINDNNIKKQKYGDDLLNIQCSICSDTEIDRFQGVYLKNDINLLYLHCNVCSNSFNGCDGGAPYILKLKDYEDLVINDKGDICKFIKKLKLRERRIEGLVRVSMDKYKEIKKQQIRKEYSDLSQQITKLNEKKCPRCERFNMLESGCSAIVCECGETYCYVCSQKVEGRGGHDTNHFLSNLNDGTAILGGYYAVQCINVNFSIVDPEDNRGPNYGYRQPIRGNMTNIGPNDAFKDLTLNTWKRYNYLREKAKRLNPNLNEEQLQNILFNEGNFWSSMNNIYYNFITGNAYELGDMVNDPDAIVNQKIAQFEEEFRHSSPPDPIFDVKDIIDLIEPNDILEIIEEREQNQREEGVEETKEGESERMEEVGDDAYLQDVMRNIQMQEQLDLEERERLELEAVAEEENEIEDVILQQAIINVLQRDDEEDMFYDFLEEEERRQRAQDVIEREVQMLPPPPPQPQPEPPRELINRYPGLPPEMQNQPYEMAPQLLPLQPPLPPPYRVVPIQDRPLVPRFNREQRFDLHNQYLDRAEYMRRNQDELLIKGQQLGELNKERNRRIEENYRLRYGEGAGAGAGAEFRILPDREFMDQVRREFIPPKRSEQQEPKRFYANGRPVQNLDELKAIKDAAGAGAGMVQIKDNDNPDIKAINDSKYERIINGAIAKIQELSSGRIQKPPIEIQNEISVLNVIKNTLETNKKNNVPFNLDDAMILKIYKHGIEVINYITFLKSKQMNYLVICKIQFLGNNYKKFFTNSNPPGELFEIYSDGTMNRHWCSGEGNIAILDINNIENMIKRINEVLFDETYRMPINTIMYDPNYNELMYKYINGEFPFEQRIGFGGGKNKKRSKRNQKNINKKMKKTKRRIIKLNYKFNKNTNRMKKSAGKNKNKKTKYRHNYKK